MSTAIGSSSVYGGSGGGGGGARTITLSELSLRPSGVGRERLAEVARSVANDGAALASSEGIGLLVIAFDASGAFEIKNSVAVGVNEVVGLCTRAAMALHQSVVK